MRKKRAFAFLETLIALMVVILLLNISINLISYNYLKSKTFSSYSDKKSLNIEEENILKEVNKKLQDDLKPGYNIGKYRFIQKGDKYYIVKRLSDSNIYIEIEMKEYNGNKIFVPTYYKTKNIVGDKL